MQGSIVPPLASLYALQDAVRALPPIASGKVRVFRGQTSDYPTITPAAYRNRLGRSAIWQVYSRFLLMDITRRRFEGEMDEKEIQIWSLWLEAVAQHYGSGSRYLDVTHSIESAAWFALHRGEWTTERSMLGPPGPPSPHDLPGETKWLQYTRAVEPGYLYAFDVDVWDGASAIPPDLALIDLSRAPEPFMTPRMLAQAGCLIHVGDADQHDLRRHRVEGTPLSVDWPMTGSTFVQRTVEEMFPTPAVDPWYRRFLSVPMAPEIDPASGGVVLKRPLPVTLYRGETEAYNAAVTSTEAFLFPPLLHRALRQIGMQAEAPGEEWWRAVSMNSATPILLEAPLLRVFPPAGSDLWNHELLLRDIDESVVSHSSSKEPPSGQAGLRNVLFQFSNFEEIFWERAHQPDITTRLTRGIWIVRGDSEILVVLLRQNFPGTQVDGSAPVLIRLDPVRRRMVLKPASVSMEWTELAAVPELAKPVFIGLHLLRALSPHLKAEATPRWFLLRRPESGPDNEYLVAVLADAGKLVRVPDPAGLADWYAMRDNEGEPYTQPKPNLVAGSFKLHDPRPFADIPVRDFQDAILAALPAEQA